MRFPVYRAWRRTAPSMRCRKSSCRPARRTPTTCWACSDRKASSASTAPASAPRPRMVSSGSCSSLRRASSMRSMTMSTTSPQHFDPRSPIRYAFVCFAIMIIALWTLYLVRGPLLLLYVCVLFATGLAPLVRWIERQRFWAVGKRRVPRTLAILVIYATVLGTLAGIGFAVVPSMVRQSQQFVKELPELIDRGQQRLVSWGLISPDSSYKELLQQSPIGGGDAVT